MASMRMGVIISVLGALIALIPIMYFITLPLDSPDRRIFTQQIMGLPLMLYFTITGAVVTAVGLLIFMRAARAPPEVAYPSPLPIRSAPRARAGLPTAAPAPQDEVVTEIEREIERIVQHEEPEAQPTPALEKEAAERKPTAEVQVVNRGQDMVCPHCGELNPLKSTRCAKCKKPLYEAEGDEPRCPVCDAPLRLSQKISEDLFTCGLCFSELRIPIELRREVGLE
jgi:phage FluMu protein Com